MQGTIGKLFAAALLTMCVGIHVVELSGRWDQTFQDANDEAGIVAVVLCIGIAVAVAGAVLKRVPVRTPSRFVISPGLIPRRCAEFRFTSPPSIGSPPLSSLRI